jgi:hypothetical protein
MNTAASENTVLHPYVAYIKRRLEALLQFVDLENNGRVVEVSGFRLKNLEHWAVEASRNLLGNLGPISGFCNAKCKFCYEIGNPLPYERTFLSLEEVRTRIKYYQPESGVGLLQPKSRLFLEPFMHPKFLDILRMVRKSSPGEVISLTTHGSFLTPEIIRELADLKPLTLVVSVNSSDPNTRRELMRDRMAAISLEALPLLREFEIPFVGSVVAWYTIPLEALATTVRFISQFEPRGIRVTLPGYSRYFSDQPLFDTPTLWSRITQMLNSLRHELHCPLIVLPNLYWNMPLLPNIDGVIRNSPADLAGLKHGDRMIRINQESILTKRQAKALLTDIQKRSQTCEMEVQRNGTYLTVTLQETDDIEADLYPYKPRGYRTQPYDRDDTAGMSYGIFLNHDFELSSITRLMDTISNYKAQRVLLLTSQIIGPIVETVIKSVPDFQAFFSEIELHLRIPSHHFWGGNIMLGDLYMVSDYLEAARHFIAQADRPPDLIILPSSFATKLGFDLLGKSYLDIERQLQIPVELVPCQRIMI